MLQTNSLYKAGKFIRDTGLIMWTPSLTIAGMGYVGAALASSVSSWLQFLLLACYAAYFKASARKAPSAPDKLTRHMHENNTPCASPAQALVWLCITAAYTCGKKTQTRVGCIPLCSCQSCAYYIGDAMLYGESELSAPYSCCD